MISGPNLILHGETEADWATDAYRLADRMPRHGWHMDGVKELRHAYRSDTLSNIYQRVKYGVSSDSRHVASIPWYVMTGLLGQYGEELMADRGKLFFKWLDRHPEYKVSR